MTRKVVHSSLGLPRRHPWIRGGFHGFARPLRRDLPGNIRSTCITVGFPAFSYAFPCALIYTEPLASPILLLWVSQFLCLYLALFVFRVPPVCSLYIFRMHSPCVPSISPEFPYTLFRALRYTQPRAFSLGFFVGYFLSPLCIRRETPMRFPVRYTVLST